MSSSGVGNKLQGREKVAEMWKKAAHGGSVVDNPYYQQK